MLLTYDSDRALDILRDTAEEAYPTNLPFLKAAVRNYEEQQERLTAGDLPIHISMTAAMNEDGTRFENLEFIANTGYVQNGALYFSNGHMTVAILEAHEQEHELLKQVINEYTA